MEKALSTKYQDSNGIFSATIGGFENSFGLSAGGNTGAFGGDFFELPPQPKCNLLSLWKLIDGSESGDKSKGTIMDFDYQ